MMSQASAYLNLKIARELFHKQLDELQAAERQRVSAVAAKQQHLEQLILSSPQAAHVMLPAASIASSLAEIRSRYDSDEDFLADLKNSGLDENELRQAIERDLKVEAILEKIASRAAQVSEVDVEIFYLMHKERFLRPETRVLRHLLVTVNPALAGNMREVSREKICGIRTRLLKDPGRFEEQVLKHSECPTAMNGGLLGAVKRGQLYPELEPIAFALEAGELSDICESPVGFHLIRCDKVEYEHYKSLAESKPRIREHLEEQRRKTCQKAWINTLQRSLKNSGQAEMPTAGAFAKP